MRATAARVVIARIPDVVDLMAPSLSYRRAAQIGRRDDMTSFLGSTAAGRGGRSVGPDQDDDRRAERGSRIHMIVREVRRGDLLLVTACLAVPLADLFLHDHLDGRLPVDPRVLVAVLSVAVQALALLARRRHPLLVVLVCCGAGLACLLAGFRSPTAVLALGAALYSIGTVASPLWSLTAAVSAAPATVTLGMVLEDEPTHPMTIVSHLAMAACPVLAGYVMRQRREALRLHLTRMVEEARSEDNLRRLRIEQERRRIARDLHDVVGHALTTISVQAAAAERLLDKRPEFARKALDEIAVAGRNALTELRAIVSVLRETDGGDDRGEEPGLAALPALIDQARSVGVEARLVLVAQHGVVEVPASVQLAVYRIVQESLTNIRRHAGAVSAVVEVDIDDEAVTTRVRNDPGPPERPDAPQPVGGPRWGAGITGMHERVCLVDGTLRAGPTPRGGFEVEAVLPCRLQGQG
jgi:signal transduction histidine kinase